MEVLLQVSRSREWEWGRQGKWILPDVEMKPSFFFFLVSICSDVHTARRIVRSSINSLAATAATLKLQEIPVAELARILRRFCRDLSAMCCASVVLLKYREQIVVTFFVYIEYTVVAIRPAHGMCENSRTTSTCIISRRRRTMCCWIGYLWACVAWLC